MLISPMEQTPPHALSKPSPLRSPPSAPPAPAAAESPPSPAPSPPSSPPALTRRHTVALPSPSHLALPLATSQPLLKKSTRNPSLSAPALTPLDFSALCSDPSSSASSSAAAAGGGSGLNAPPPCTARRNIDAITSSLSRLRPFLYVTSAHGARSLASLREAAVTHIINVAGATSNNFFAANPAFSYLKLCPRDDATEDISVLLDHTTAFIDAARALSPQSRIAIHCRMGVSRSATVAAAYLIMTEGLTFDAAFAELRTARPIADPNPSFSRALSSLATRVREGRKRPQLFRVQPHPHTNCSDDSRSPPQPFIIASPQPPTVEDDGAEADGAPGAHFAQSPPHIDPAHVWILAHPARRGFEVLCGPDAPAAHFVRGVEIARLYARHEERYEQMFPIANRGSIGARVPFSCPVAVHGRESWSRDIVTRFVEAVVIPDRL